MPHFCYNLFSNAISPDLQLLGLTPCILQTRRDKLMLLTHMLGKCTHLAYIGLMRLAVEGKGFILMFGAWI